MCKISIIIPTFNSGAVLSSSLCSIRDQGFQDIEVIIQDGGSTDNTLEIATKFNEVISSLKVFSEKDNGIYDAMNKAMKKAKGEWMIFMGSDDTFHSPDVLKKVVKVISTTNADVVYGSVSVIGDTGWAKDGDIYDGPFNVYKLLNQNICHQAMFYRRSFVEKEIGEFNTYYTISADWDFNLRCWAKKPFEYIDLVISNFSAGGLSTFKGDTRVADDFINNVMSYFNIGLFDKLINRPSFIYFSRVVEMQKERYPVKFKLQKLKSKILKRLRG